VLEHPGTNSGIYQAMDTGGTPRNLIFVGGDNNVYMVNDIQGSAYVIQVAASSRAAFGSNYVWFSARGTYTDLFITTSGQIGVGTPSPQQLLTVAGDVGQSVVAANGIVKAAALVNGSTPSIIRSFNNLPGGTGPSVSQPLGPGTYEVNFGVNVAQRFFLATLLSSNSTDPGGASDGQVLASTRDGNASAVFVRTNDSTGTSTNRSFYLMIF